MKTDYLTNITHITVEKERIGAELDIATRIQAELLPSVFPDRDDFDIYASMTPAREVGGDFYDFFFVDEDHLGLVMADVSGKGVPAAMFMAIAKTLIKNSTRMGETPFPRDIPRCQWKNVRHSSPPFAAVADHDEAIHETARVTEEHLLESLTLIRKQEKA